MVFHPPHWMGPGKIPRPGGVTIDREAPTTAYRQEMLIHLSGGVKGLCEGYGTPLPYYAHSIMTWRPVNKNNRNENNASTTCLWLVRLKNIGGCLQITLVNAEHNHRLKSSKTPIEACGGKTVKKTQ